MNTLIFNGSPRTRGDTSFLVERLRAGLDGNVTVIRAADAGVRPCCDCRWCWDHVGCSIDDAMQPIYRQIIDADNIVIASPLYFSELNGALLSMMSRLQTFYTSRRFLGVKQVEKPKRGGLILCGGGDGGPKRAEETARVIFRFMNTKCLRTVYSLHTDDLPACEDAEAVRQIDELAAILNK
ncbi:MAG: flavodoxin family protein [Clostridia bacterium]|nr:flavodoxin family protein [Clostridia bacterium]